jgi:hypothetical protein
MSGVQTKENAVWWKSFTGCPKFVCSRVNAKPRFIMAFLCVTIQKILLKNHNM